MRIFELTNQNTKSSIKLLNQIFSLFDSNYANHGFQTLLGTATNEGRWMNEMHSSSESYFPRSIMWPPLRTSKTSEGLLEITARGVIQSVSTLPTSKWTKESCRKRGILGRRPAAISTLPKFEWTQCRRTSAVPIGHSFLTLTYCSLIFKTSIRFE